MAWYPSGISSELLEPTGDADVWLARVLVAVDEQPLGTSAPCVNPECGKPVDYTGHGLGSLHCSRTCRARVATLRVNAHQQLEVLEQLLDETKGWQEAPREALHARARQIRWWLARLATADERTDG